MANPESDEASNPDNQAKQRSWFAVRFGSADAWTALATIFLVGVGIWGIYETRHSLKLSERAWLSVVTLGLTAPFEDGKPIHFNVVGVNFGKQPAINVAYAQENGTIKAPPNDDWSGMQVGENHTCDGLKPIKGSIAVLPSTNGLGSLRGSDSTQGISPMVASKAILDGVIHYYVRGCVAYETFEEVHTSSYCYVLQSKPNTPVNQMPFLTCPTGFDAN
jgi:hypothetical protein